MSSRAFGKSGWTPDALSDLSGKNYVITGGNSGIGFEAARRLGEKAARVTILCRSEDKARRAVEELAQAAPAGSFDMVLMDLTDLSSVREAAKQVRGSRASIDGLVNNAGIMMIPKRELTKDGFETQFGVNHLGHFVLNAELCDLVEAAAGRFVSVASIAHKYAHGFNFDDLMYASGYNPIRAYAQSKLANLVYALELNRKLTESNCAARAYACHPGYSDTNLQTTGPGGIAAMIMRPLTAMLSQPAAKGAIPTVLCAAGAEAEAGGYYGPTGFREFSGPVDRASISPFAKNRSDAQTLWTASEKLTDANWKIFG